MIVRETDGAANNIGGENGSIAFHLKDNKYIGQIHCYSHKLKLALDDSIDEIPYLNKFINCISK